MDNTKFLAVSILASTFVLSLTLVYLFGPSGGTGRTAETAPIEDIGGGGAAGGQRDLSVNRLKALARDLGADGGEFDSCMDSDKYASAVQADFDEGSSLGVNGTPTFFINGTVVVGAQPFESIASAIDQELANPTASPVDVIDAPSIGDANAPVTIVEFSDYECPFCQSFFLNTLPSVKSSYIDTGQARLVYKDFPLSSLHPSAQKAAEAARCVRDQLRLDGYWAMHDAMFGGV